MARHFCCNVLSIFLVPFMLGICCLGQEYKIDVEFPMIVFGEDIFSNTSSPEYIELQGYVKDGLLLIAPKLNISGDVTITLEENKMKRSQFHVPADPKIVAEFLYKLMFSERLIIDDQSTSVTSLTCTGGVTDLKYPSQSYSHECEIRERLSPCLGNQKCHRENDDQWLSCVDIPPVPAATEIPVEIHKRDENLVIVLAYGAAFFALMLIFLIVYCWRKGCANRRKQRELDALGSAVYRPEDLTMM